MDFNFTGIKDFCRDVVNNPLAPGIIGSMLGLRSASGKGWGTVAYNFIAAIALVKYGAPWLVDLWGIKAESSIALLGFAVGWGGLNVADMFLIVLRDQGPDLMKRFLTAWVTFFTPKGPSKE